MIHVGLAVMIRRLLAIHLITLGLTIGLVLQLFHSFAMLIRGLFRVATHKGVVCVQLFKADPTVLPEVDGGEELSKLI